MTSFTTSVVVPVYHSEGTLVELVHRVQTVLPTLVSAFGIILANDGSRDESWSVITELAEQNPNISGLNLMHNYGQHNTLLAGRGRSVRRLPRTGHLKL
jgi:undecaprenyl-phosphate 4-deoxy-4-formamido-L-arabinose transferase